MSQYELKYKGCVHVFDTDKVTFDGVDLPDIPNRILLTLVMNDGKATSQEDIFEAVWGYPAKDLLRKHIKRLREIIGDKDCSVVVATKERPARYRLDCEIFRIDEQIVLCDTQEKKPHTSSAIFTSAKSLVTSDIDNATEFNFRSKDFENFKLAFNNSMHSSKRFAIVGNGGIGKTTFARILFRELRGEYSYIGWVNYSVNLDDSLLASIDIDQNESRSQVDRLNKIDDFLKSPEKKLLIIDNVVEDAEHSQFPQKENGFFSLERLSADVYYNLDIIITTRANYPLYTTFYLPELDVVSGSKLFLYYFDPLTPFELYDEEADRIIGIIIKKYAYMNTLLIELYAKACRFRFNTLNDLYSYLNKYGHYITEKNIPTTHSRVNRENNDNNSIVDQIRDLYRIEELNEEMQRVLWEFAILPKNTWLYNNDIKDFMNLESDDEMITELANKGWLIYRTQSSNNQDKYGYSMHDVIRESILTRLNHYRLKSVSTVRNSPFSISWISNISGFAPDFCYRELISNTDKIDELFDAKELSYTDIDKRIKVLSSISNYLKISNDVVWYLFGTIGYYTFHKLGNKEYAENYLRKSLIYYKDYAEQIWDKAINKWFEDEKNGKKSSIKANEINPEPKLKNSLSPNRLRYELAYVLSSMGYEKLGEAYEIMSQTVNPTYAKYGGNNRYDKCFRAYEAKTGSSGLEEQCYKCFPDLIITNEMFEACRSLVPFKLKSPYIDEYNDIARILDHAAYIITIYKPSENELAEKYLVAALKIRRIIHKIHSLKQMSLEEYSDFTRAFIGYFEQLYNIITGIKTPRGQRGGVIDYSKIDPYEILSKYASWFIPGQSSSFREDLSYADKLRDSHYFDYYGTNGLERYMWPDSLIILILCLLREDYKKWYLRLPRFTEIDMIDLIEKYFVCYSNSNYTSSLQEVATTEDNLGYLYIQENRFDEAEELLVSAKKHRMKLEKVEKSRHTSELSWTYNNLGELYLRKSIYLGDCSYLRKAKWNYLKAVCLRKELCKRYKERYLDNLAWSYTGLYRCYLYCLNDDKAEQYKDKALSIYKTLNADKKYNNEISILNKEIDISGQLTWLGNQSHFKI